jgi:hypothetical protein
MNFTFLSPVFLLGLPLASIPWLIHLFSRRRPKLYLFSYVNFIKSATRKVIQRYKITQWLLLIIRTWILLLLTLLFCRPFVQQVIFPLSQSKNLPKVIILDGSYSMWQGEDKKSAFEEGKEITQRLLEFIPQETEIHFFLVSNRIVTRFLAQSKKEVELLKKRLTPLKATFEATDFLPVFQELSQLKSPLQIFIITDLGKNAWRRVSAVFKEKPLSLSQVFLIDTGVAEGVNLAVGEISVTETTLNERKFQAKIKNFSSQTVSQKSLRLFLGEASQKAKRRGEIFITLKPNEEKEVSFPYKFPSPGVYKGYLELDEDTLNVDNKFFFCLKISPPLKVLCVDGEPHFIPAQSETFFLSLALNPQAKGARVKPRVVPFDEIEKVNFEEFKLIFLCNISELKEEVVKKLLVYLKKGGNLFFFLGSKVSPEVYNQTYGSLLPARLLSLKEAEAKEEIIPPHPNLREFHRSRIPFKIKLKKYFQLKPHPSATTLLILSSGAPLLVEKKFYYQKPARSFVFASSADLDWNNFAAKPTFLGLIHQILALLQTETTSREKLGVNEPIEYKLPPGASLPTVITPSGKSHAVKITPERAVDFKKTSLPGIYTLSYTTPQGKKYKYFPVNLKKGWIESSLERIPLEALKNILQPAKVTYLRKGEFWNKLLTTKGGELRKELIFILFGLLFFEVFLRSKGTPSQKKKTGGKKW